MQDLLVEIQRLQCHVLPEPTWTHTVLHARLVAREGPADLLGLDRRLVRLQDHVVQGVRIKYPEIVVV